MSGRTIKVAATGTLIGKRAITGTTLAGAMIAGTLIAGTLISQTALADSRKEYRFNVGSHAGVSVNNPYGSISVKPSTGNTVVINALLRSDKVEVDNSQSGNRIEIQSHLLAGADATSGRVDYDILVPIDASISLHSA